MRVFITALRTLTIIPVYWPGRENFAAALPYFPLAGLVVALPSFLIAFIIGGILGWPLGGGVLAVACATFLTGGLHVDGLADGFDSMGGRTREKRLQIMKDPRVGSYGVAAIVLVLMIKAAAIASLCEYSKDLWVLVPFVVARGIQVFAIVRMPYAREDGTARPFVEGARGWHAVVALTLSLVLALALGQLAGLAVWFMAFVVAFILMGWMRRTVGGITGDLIGMTSELVEAAGFVVLGVMRY
jgi:adenosylcobinamide-GDP ribazoletransferase